MALIDRGWHKASSMRQSFSYRWLSAPARPGLGAGARGEPDEEGEEEAALRLDGEPRRLRLAVPMPACGGGAGFADVLSAWTSAAMRSLAGAAADGPSLSALVPMVALPVL